jgi:RimJ/RimL family protein N-acetyltransferase
VTSADHEAWFARRLSDPDCRIFIVEAAGRPAGQLRLEKARGAAEVSFSVSPDARGFGIGTEILKRAPRLARRTLNVTTLVAHVMPANVASAVAFLKAGFELTGRRRRRGTDVYEFRLITE